MTIFSLISLIVCDYKVYITSGILFVINSNGSAAIQLAIKSKQNMIIWQLKHLN